LVILAINAAQITAGEKYRSGPGRSDKRRLFAKMLSKPGDFYRVHLDFVK
jgi:hypothetical protein